MRRPPVHPDLESLVFFFNDTAPTEIYTLSLHDALPICRHPPPGRRGRRRAGGACSDSALPTRSEEHTSELQSRFDLVCRLLLEKKYAFRGRLMHVHISKLLTCHCGLCHHS